MERFEQVVQDLKFAARSLRKQRAFTSLAVLTLGLGIGANTAIFTAVRAALLRPLPFRDAESVVHLWETTPTESQRQLSYPDFVDLRAGAKGFAGIAGYAFDRLIWTTPDGPQRIDSARVSANFLSVLGVEPQLGRSFADAEDAVGRPRDVAVVSDRFWRRELGADGSVLGRTLELDGTPMRVIGVLPANFEFARLGQPDVLTTLSAPQQRADRRYMHWMWAIGRLQPGSSLDRANADLETLAARRATDDARWHAGTGLSATSIRGAMVGGVRPILLGLLCATLAVLLMASANVANMLLARGTARTREVGVRAALGASRARLVSQFLTESLLLASLGGIAGILFAIVSVRVLVAGIPNRLMQGMPYLRDLHLDGGVLAFAFVCVLGTALLFGIAPALRAAEASLSSQLGSGGRTIDGHSRLRAGLVAGEIALALVLLAGAGLLARSAQRLLGVDPGFRTEHLQTVRVTATDAKYEDAATSQAFFAQLAERTRAIPGVRGVAFVDRLPMLGSGNTGTPSIVGRPPAGADDPSAQLRTVSREYFDVMGIPRVSGRTFSPDDRAATQPVVVVNRALAQRIFPGESAVGQAITFAFTADHPPFEIVGVVGDENVVALDSPAPGVVYFSFSQESAMATSMVVRTAGEPGALASSIRSTARALDAGTLVTDSISMDELIAAAPATFLRRYPLLLLGSFAGLALLLACVGIYGVMSFSVAQRTQEFGVRMALGATRRDLLRLVLGQGTAMTAIGIGLGLIVALGAGRLVQSLLFSVSPGDPLTLAAAAAVLAAVATLASLVPAFRAARLSPMEAQRSASND